MNIWPMISRTFFIAIDIKKKACSSKVKSANLGHQSNEVNVNPRENTRILLIAHQNKDSDTGKDQEFV